MKKVFSQVANITHGRITPSAVFADFLSYGALLLSIRTDSVHQIDRLGELQQLKSRYNDSEWGGFHEAIKSIGNIVVQNVDHGHFSDLFVDAYRDFGARSKALGQDFTPEMVAKAMSRLTTPSDIPLPECGYFTLLDPACGSGSLLLSYAENLQEHRFNPSMQFVIQAVDVDIRCVYMTYLNLSLYGIPAVVIHGDSLKMQEYSRWYTPMYILGRWVWREPMLLGNNGVESSEALKKVDESLRLLYEQMGQIVLPFESALRAHQDEEGG